MLKQPLCSPDFALCDVFLFPKLRGIIKRTCFKDMEAIKRAVMIKLRGIPEESSQQCIEVWKSALALRKLL